MDSVVGFIVELDSNQNIKQTGYGIRYRVRRLGIDSPATPANKLPWFDVLLPPTEGSGDGLKARSVNYSVGDMVVVEHMDSSKQHGWIKGHFARTSLIQYSGDVKTADQTTASGGDQGGEVTLPTKVNKGRGKPGESKTADSEEEKDAIEAVKKGTGATDSTKVDDPNADVPISSKVGREARYTVIGEDGKTEYQRSLERVGETPERAAEIAAEARKDSLGQ
jgi:hypothetical protein